MPDDQATSYVHKETLSLREQIDLRFKCIAIVSQSVGEANRTMRNILIGTEVLYDFLTGDMKATEYDARIPPDIRRPPL